MSSLREDVNENSNTGLSILVQQIDSLVEDKVLFGWRRAILELDQIRCVSMIKLNEKLKAHIDKKEAAMIRDRFKLAIMSINRDVDFYLTKRSFICGNDSMEQIIVDSTLRRLHYQIELIRLSLNLLGCDSEAIIGITRAVKILLF